MASIKWLLVVIMMNTPVKTDLVFDSLSECREAEGMMMEELKNSYAAKAPAVISLGATNNKLQAKKSGLKNMITGVCIPTK